MIGTQTWGLFASLGITVVLLFVAARLLRRIQFGPRGVAANVPLRVLKRVALGPKQSVAIVQAADRALVVSIGDGGARLLTEIMGDEAARLLAEPSPDAHEVAEARPRVRSGRPSLAAIGRLIGVRFGPLVLAAILLAGLCLADIAPAQAQAGGAAGFARGGTSTPLPIPPKVDVRIGEGSNSLQLSGTVGLVVVIGLMTLLPALFLLMTSFTRILIVLQFLRPALGTQSAPPAQLLTALAILLTGVVMNPVLQQANLSAVQPFLRGEISQVQAYERGVVPFREFMLANTRDKDLALFTELSGVTDAASYEEVPTVTLVSAFVTSELRTAFQMGFLIFLPFVILDVIVASVLMSLGMFMLPPMMVSMPFKLLLFVIADGWGLVIQNLVLSFKH